MRLFKIWWFLTLFLAIGLVGYAPYVGAEDSLWSEVKDKPQNFERGIEGGGNLPVLPNTEFVAPQTEIESGNKPGGIFNLPFRAVKATTRFVGDTAKDIYRGTRDVVVGTVQTVRAKAQDVAGAVIDFKHAARQWAIETAVNMGITTVKAVVKPQSIWDREIYEFIHGEPYGQPPIPLPKTAEEYNEKINKYKTLINTARKRARTVSPREARQLLELADNLEKDIQSLEMALIAKDVYDSTGARNPALEAMGWHRLSDEELLKIPLDPYDFHPDDSGFRAGLYVNINEEGKVILAFKGTTLTSLEDWQNNTKQALGANSDYYRRALNLSRIVNEAIEFEVGVVGHSLGGGMASASCEVFHTPCFTFNSAGVHPDTVDKYGIDKKELRKEIKAIESNIQEYIVDGEVLNSMQDKVIWLPGKISNTIYMPQSLGVRRTLPAVDEEGRRDPVWKFYGFFSRHPQVRVINGIRQNEAEDVAALIKKVQLVGN